MRTLARILALCVALGAGTGSLRAQSTARDANSLLEQGLATQRAAVAAMRQSLEKQKASVRRQGVPSSADKFFVLSPPVALAASLPAGSPSAECAPLPASEIDTLVNETARKDKVDEALLRSVMGRESAFRPCAVSPKGAVGLMQLMPQTLEQFGVVNPFDPAENASAGAKLLRQLLTRYKGDLPLALGAYNAGAGAVDNADGVPPFRETMEYVNSILSILSRRP